MAVYQSNSLELSFLQTMEETDYTSKALAGIYGCSLLGVVSLVCVVYSNRSYMVIGRVLAYLLSLSTMTLAVKSVYVSHGFNFPKFVTCTHFMSCGIFCFSNMAYYRYTEQKPIKVPSLKQMTHVILPIAVAFALSIAANNIALLHSNAAFAEMVGASAPLCVIAIALAMGKGFDGRLIWPVLTVVVGVAVCASGELKFTWTGFALIFVATFLRGLKQTLQHAVMEEGSDRLGPI
jgi:hypothetical protein